LVHERIRKFFILGFYQKPMSVLTTEQAEEFQRLDRAVVEYWSDAYSAETFRRLLCSTSSAALNAFDMNGWTTLTYVLSCIHGAKEEIKTLQTLFGPDVATEDHSRLRIDRAICTRTRRHNVLVISASHTAANQVCEQRSPKEILQLRATGKFGLPNYKSPFESHVAIAEMLLRQATERIQTYPKRLMLALTDACTNYLPTTALYTVISGYLCH
jgi:hypothetical protein